MFSRYWALQQKCHPRLIFKPFFIESTHIRHRYLTVTAEMGEPASGKSWPNMCLLQKPSQPSLKLISHQWESPDFLVSPCWFPSCSAACWWYRKAAVPKPFSLVTPHRRLGKLLCGKADRQTPSATGSRCPAEMGSMFHTPKVKNALKCLAKIFFFFNNPPFFP